MRVRNISWHATLSEVLICVLLCACSSGQVAGTGQGQDGDPDQEVANLERELTEAGPDSARVQAQLDAARDRAVAVHVEAGGRALRNHELGHAEGELQLAMRHLPEDPRVAGLRLSIAGARRQVAQTVTNCRGRLERLAGLEARAEDRGEWLALLADLDELSLWEHELPDAAHVRQEARGPAVTWLLTEAKQQLAAGDGTAARASLDRAEALTPGAPAVALARQAIEGIADVASLLRQADELAAQGKHAQARKLYQQVLARDPGNLAARKAVADGKVLEVRVLLEQVKVERLAGRVDRAIAAANEAVAVGTENAALAAEARKVATDLNGRLIGGLYAKMQAAQGRKLDAAAWLYAREIATLVGPAAATDSKQIKDVRKRLAGLEASVQAKAAYRLVLSQGPVPKDAPAGVAAALSQGARARLTAALGRAVTVLAKASKQADGSLAVQVPTFTVNRYTTPEARSKQFLDRTEVVDNAKYFEAQGRQSTALAALTQGLDALRPVQEEINLAQRELHQSKLQLTEIEQKIVSEDTAYYKGRTSPCPGGKLDCPKTRGHERWQANVAYYSKAIAKQEAVLRDLEPERLKMQRIVDEKQAGYDEAVKVAAETPRRVPKEVWLPYDYQVVRHDLAVDATLTVALTQVGAEPVRGQAVVQEARSDLASDGVEVKGQVLEPQKASGLPGDATLVADVTGRLLDAALPAVVQLLARHGERFVRLAGAAKDDLTRVHWLVLAAQAGEAMPVETRAQVLQQLADLTGWHADTGKLDVDRLQLAPEKAGKTIKPKK